MTALKETTGRGSFMDEMFRLSRERDTESVVVPRDGEIAMISGRESRDGTVVSMRLFKLAPDEAERLVRYSEYDSIKILDIPSLPAADPDQEMKHDIAPHLYVMWLLQDTDTLAGFLSGDDDLWDTGILDAVRKAAGATKSKHGNLVIDPDGMEEWLDELMNSDQDSIADFGRFLSETWQDSCADRADGGMFA
jgi:hypothetical protein